MMLQSTKIWSVQPLPFLKPAYSSLRHSAIVVDILIIIISAKILLGTDRSVIPHQLLQLFNALFWNVFLQSEV